MAVESNVPPGERGTKTGRVFPQRSYRLKRRRNHKPNPFSRIFPTVKKIPTITKRNYSYILLNTKYQSPVTG